MIDAKIDICYIMLPKTGMSYYTGLWHRGKTNRSRKSRECEARVPQGKLQHSSLIKRVKVLFSYWTFPDRFYFQCPWNFHLLLIFSSYKKFSSCNKNWPEHFLRHNENRAQVMFQVNTDDIQNQTQPSHPHQEGKKRALYLSKLFNYLVYLMLLRNKVAFVQSLWK